MYGRRRLRVDNIIASILSTLVIDLGQLARGPTSHLYIYDLFKASELLAVAHSIRVGATAILWH